MKKYIPNQIEPKWQQKWAEDRIYKVDLNEASKKFYLLVEFTYPSGDLHIGHWFAFAVPDVLARLKRMQGYSVFFPNGFDAFGLPAENAAIARGIHPKDWTLSNIENMKRQFTLMGAIHNWDNSVITCLPEYYKWNQWIFTKMLEKGLAYKGKALANWCDFCQTVLANENVESGTCWRCHNPVIQKQVDQWFLKITEYADRLMWDENGNGLDWPKATREGQNNWIGRSEGALVKFSELEVFTTRPDTLFGATFVVISPEHPMLKKLTVAKNEKQVEQYVSAAAKKSELERKENKDKTGVFTGGYVKNPVNGEDVPVWVADYVLAGYGTGAIMAVPAHDERDFEFANKFNLPIRTVVEPIMGTKGEDEEFRKSIVAIVYDTKNKKYLSINWGKELGGNLFIGGGIDEGEDPIETAKREIEEETGCKNVKFVAVTEKIHHHYRAHSKNINREIEAVGLYFELIDDTKGQVKLEDDEKGKFEVEWLTEAEAEKRVTEDLHGYVFQKLIKGLVYAGEGILVDSGQFSGLNSNEAKKKISNYLEEGQFGKAQVQYHLHDWSISRQRYWGTPIPIINCPECGVVAVPEKDLPVELPYEVDYTPKGKPPLATDEEWVNVKCPSCGGSATRETETMDTFVDSSWYFLRYLDNKNDKELAGKKRLEDWMPVDIYFGGSEHTLGHTLYSRFFVKFLKDIGVLNFEEYAKRRINHGVILGPDGHRMSKSKGNVINPDQQVNEYGADAVRMYLSFIGPYDIVAAWNPDGINGVYHFLQRVWGLQEKVNLDKSSMTDSDLQIMHKTIKKVGEDISEIKFNTAVASLMEWLNHLSRKSEINKEEFKTLLMLLAPFAPHITEELWAQIGEEYSVHQQSWPQFDNKFLEVSEFSLVVQVNGKMRDSIMIQKDMESNKKDIEDLALKSIRVAKYIDGKTVKKVVHVPGRLVNIVI
jgi:leucyl-tRNA synthetase